MSELHELGIEESAKGLAKGEFSSVELTQAVIDRVHARDGEIGAYLTFDEEARLRRRRRRTRSEAARAPLPRFSAFRWPSRT